MAEITVAVINASTFIQDVEVKAAVEAFQTQVHNDFAPVWGIDARLIFLANHPGSDNIADMLKALEPLRRSWWLVILDNSDLGALLGYHDLTSEGLPQEKVFAETDIQMGRGWTVSASRALLQMLVDPAINLTAFRQTNEAPGRFYAYDVCNPCKADKYEINGIRVSNFVYPAWFEYFHKPGSTQFDHLHLVQAPFELRPSGEIDVLDVDPNTAWHTLISALVSEGEPNVYRMRPSVGSRRERRKIPPDQWQPSEPRSMLPGRPIPPDQPPQ